MKMNTVPPLATAVPDHFPATRWSLVEKVRSEEFRDRALGELLESYWRPLWVFARGTGLSAEDAEDAVQGFCESLIRRRSLRTAVPERGRLRSFLLQALRNHLRDQWRGKTRERRGGGGGYIQLEEAESRGSAPLTAREPDPCAAFERQWAMTLLERAVGRLREEFEARGKARHFELLESSLAWNGHAASHRETAERLGISEAAVQQAVVRLRARYRRLLEEEIALTVDGSPDESEAERAWLIRVITG